MKTDRGVIRLGKIVLAVEVANDAIKIVQADTSKRNGAISKVHIQRLEGGAAPSASAVLEALKGGGFARVPVIAVLPRQMVNIRMLEFPSVDYQEIADMVELQVGRQTPYSRDEIVIDFKILKSEREGYSRVMLVIVQSTLVRHRFGLLEEAGLEIAQMSISTEGLLNWFAARPADAGSGGGDVALLDIDTNTSDFCALRGGQLAYTRGIPVGSSSWPEEAEGQPEGRFFEEVGRAIETYRSETAGARIDRLIVTGAEVNTKALEERLNGEFGVTLVSRSSWADPATTSAGAALQKPGVRRCSITALIGAILRPQQLDVDLTPEAVVIRRSLEVRARSLSNFGILVMALVVASALLVEGRVVRKYAQFERFQKWTGDTNKDADNVESMEKKAATVTARLDHRLAPVNLLSEIQERIPETIYLTALQIEAGKQVKLVGNAGSVADILRFVTALEASPLLANVKSTRTTTGRDKTEFEIVCLPEK